MNSLSALFKGGTSLSKCYPGSIERFSEDIDLTFVPVQDMNNKKYSKELKRIEAVIADGFQIEKIEAERNDRNKSAYVWPEHENRDSCRIKTYIQEYLEKEEMDEVVQEFDLQEVFVNTLDITRTFLDKVMAVKRHAICGTLERKVRHIYDVTVLFRRTDIQTFLKDTERLKQLLKLTKETDSFYLQKRNISEEYDPIGAYDFESWKHKFDYHIRERYESLHEDLLYTFEKQNFDDAIVIFEKINEIFSGLGG